MAVELAVLPMPSARAPAPTERNSLLYFGASAALEVRLQAIVATSMYVNRLSNRVFLRKI
jgi:hypothetical protein